MIPAKANNIKACVRGMALVNRFALGILGSKFVQPKRGAATVVSSFLNHKKEVYSLPKPHYRYSTSLNRDSEANNDEENMTVVTTLRVSQDDEDTIAGLTKTRERKPRVAVPVSVDDPKIITAASFAVNQFNKEKNPQLHFVRVVEAKKVNACCQHCVGHLTYFIRLEAIDAGAVKVYLAKVFAPDGKSMKLKLFGLADNKSNDDWWRDYFSEYDWPEYDHDLARLHPRGRLSC